MVYDERADPRQTPTGVRFHLHASAYTARMRHIGIDFGRSRIGIAVSDAAGSIAFPRTIITNDEKAIPYIVRLVENEQAAAVVVGDTRTFSGGENDVTADADAFASALVAALSVGAAVPVRRAPEAWSSAEAARFAPAGKKHDDASAAAIILQRFLDGVE